MDLVWIIIGSIAFILFIAIWTIAMLFIFLRPTKGNIISKKIIYSAKQDNTNSTITDLVLFAKSHDIVDYKIDE